MSPASGGGGGAAAGPGVGRRGAHPAGSAAASRAVPRPQLSLGTRLRRAQHLSSTGVLPSPAHLRKTHTRSLTRDSPTAGRCAAGPPAAPEPLLWGRGRRWAAPLGPAHSGGSHKRRPSCTGGPRCACPRASCGAAGMQDALQHCIAAPPTRSRRRAAASRPCTSYAHRSCPLVLGLCSCPRAQCGPAAGTRPCPGTRAHAALRSTIDADLAGVQLDNRRLLCVSSSI